MNDENNLKRNELTQSTVLELVEILKGQKLLAKGLHKKKMPMDLSDLGNVVGLVIEQVAEANPDLMGFTMDDFLSGVKHGQSIVNGTHG